MRPYLPSYRRHVGRAMRTLGQAPMPGEQPLGSIRLLLLTVYTYKHLADVVIMILPPTHTAGNKLFQSAFIK